MFRNWDHGVGACWHQQMGCNLTRYLLRAQHSRPNRRFNDACGLTHADGLNHRPASGAFLPGLIHDHIDHFFAGGRIFRRQNLSCDLDQIALKRTTVPTAKHRCNLTGRQP